MSTPLQRIQQLEAQVADLTKALTAFLAGNLDGAGSAKGYLLAIDPTIEVTPANFEFDQ
jgi:hypothetical protein